MLSACSHVYADKFTACVENVRLPNARTSSLQYKPSSLSVDSLLNSSTNARPTFSETDHHGVRRSFKTRLQSCFFCRAGGENKRFYHRDVLLTQKLLPVIRQISGNEFVFQQDCALAHRARETIKFLRRETRRTLQGV